MLNRNTRQKDLILEIIKTNRIHPTIYQIYDLVKEVDPTIGQATIYRNVKRFVEEGKVFILKTKQGIDRYDFYNGHLHFECLICGKITDIFDEKIFQLLKEQIKERKEQVINYTLLLDGYCPNCQKVKLNVETL